MVAVAILVKLCTFLDDGEIARNMHDLFKEITLNNIIPCYWMRRISANLYPFLAINQFQEKKTKTQWQLSLLNAVDDPFLMTKDIAFSRHTHSSSSTLTLTNYNMLYLFILRSSLISLRCKLTSVITLPKFIFALCTFSCPILSSLWTFPLSLLIGCLP